MDQLKADQKKEIKKFESDKRTALKKVKGTAGKGKKGKEALATAEQQWEEKHKVLLQKHEEQATSISAEVEAGTGTGVEEGTGTGTDTGNHNQVEPNQQSEETTSAPKLSKEEEAKQKALMKKMRKRQNALAKEKAREEQIAYETANAPDPRQMEIDAIMELYLNKDNLDIEEVAADGNCLYRAVARQLDYLGGGSGSGSKSKSLDYLNMRQKCAQEIMEKRDEYEPFADLSEMKVSTFEEYVDKVRDSSEWGGHLELKAMAHSLNKTIIVYSTEGPLEIRAPEPEVSDDEQVIIRLSFHRRYYALGEHYNSVIRKVNE